MKRVFFAAAVAFVLLFSGCSNNPVTPGATVKIAGSISYQNNSGVIAQTVYSVTVLEGSSPVAGASASVTGPHGTTSIPEVGSGMYMYQETSNPLTLYQKGETYTVTVVYNGKTYTAAGTAPGGAVIAGDGSSVTWTNEGNLDVMTVTFMGAGSPTASVGPDAVSPANLNATGIYSNGSGTYMITSNVTRQVLNAFSGATIDSTLSLIEQVMASVSK